MSRDLMPSRYIGPCETDQERMMIAVVALEAWGNGHGDEGSCGVAEFGLIEFAEAVSVPPGRCLRALKKLAEKVGGVCVVSDTDLVLFAVYDGSQSAFERLYVARGFGENPPAIGPFAKA